MDQIKVHFGDFKSGKIGKADGGQELWESDYRNFVKGNPIRMGDPLIGKNVKVISFVKSNTFR